MFERFRRKKPQDQQPAPGQGGSGPQGQGKAPGEVLAPFLEAALPDAIDELAFRVSMGVSEGSAPITGFERYAARLLDEAGASRLRPIAAEHPLEAVRLDSTGLFWLHFDGSELTADQLERVLATEAALNRLALVEGALAAKPDEAVTEERCSLEDWRLIRSVADGAQALLDKSAPSNERLSQGDARAPRGGNWDVLTCLAGRCEEERLAGKNAGLGATKHTAIVPVRTSASRR